MKVLLIKDVPGVGHRGQVKDVSDGYAHNFLFARKLAVPEKAGIATAIKAKEEASKQAIEHDQKMLIQEIASIDGLIISISRKANEKGHLFAALQKSEILELISKQKEIKHIDESMIQVDKPIKEVGKTDVSVVAKAKKAKITLDITPA